MRFSDVFGPIKWHVLACFVVFFGLPLIGNMIDPQMQPMFAIVCGVINNLVITITCIWIAIKDGFIWYYPIAAIFLYVISLFSFYPALTAEMTTNIISYLTMAYICQIIGIIIGKIIERNR